MSNRVSAKYSSVFSIIMMEYLYKLFSFTYAPFSSNTNNSEILINLASYTDILLTVVVLVYLCRQTGASNF